MFELLEHKLHVVHAPHRWYALEEDIHGVNQLRVIGGVSDCCLKKGIQFYHGERQNEEQKCLGIPMHAVPDIEIAELLQKLLKMQIDICKLRLRRTYTYTVKQTTQVFQNYEMR